MKKLFPLSHDKICPIIWPKWMPACASMTNYDTVSYGEGRVRVITVQNFKVFVFTPPHPDPLPPGERGVPDGN